LQCRDRNKKFIISTTLVDLIDMERSQNITKVEVRDGNSVRITKTISNCETIIYFAEALTITSINIFPTALTGSVWGYITSLRFFSAPSDIKTFDASGKSVNFFDISDSAMKTFKFREISYIPTIFEPENTPLEVIYNAEYLLYTVRFTGDIPPVIFYGMNYRFKNEDNFQSMHHARISLDISEFTGSRAVSVYGDAHRTASFIYAFQAFDRTANKTIVTNYESITYTVQNTGASTLTDVLVVLPAPNVGYSYTFVDGVCGLNQDLTIATSLATWDGNKVLVKISSLSVGTTDITLVRGNFESSLTGTLAGATVITTPKLIYLPSVEVYVPLLLPTASIEFCVLLDTEPVPSPTNPFLSITSDTTVGFVDITELSGNNTTNAQVRADVSEVLFHYDRSIPLVIYDRNSNPIETIYVNTDGTFTNSVTTWNGTLIQFKVSIQGGATTRFYLRVKNENGNVANFTALLYASYASNVISVDAGLRAIGEINSLIDYKILDGFPTLIYKHSGINETIVETITEA